ncbi:sodium-solute symporter, putative [Lunatimonas lonarensis]|uniref:Sodium-solute symporter, putative n=1 Tax=Lunatimonas lonarensis TaxID=1232681 RepID=R7ZPF2_9BACT|nr:sodium:solute symporter family protein [Lunatimonas lonarensis]EON75996.1 sodium-solute symporter, putative [Lunatimonas lonarensis]
MQSLDYISIFVFTLIILAAGLSFGGSGKDMKSFFAAGGAVPWSISGLSLFMSFFSAGTFVVWGSIAYQWGFVAITIQMTMCLSGFLIGRWLAPKWKQAGSLTVAEYLTRRFGKSTQQYYTYLFLILSLGYTGAFLYPVAKVLNVVTGMDIYWSIWVLGGMIMVYTAVGGLWAVVVTDVLQFVILTAAVLIVLPLAFTKVGGVERFIADAPDTFFKVFNGEYTPVFIVAFILYNTIFIGGNWAYVQRYTSVATVQSARKVGYLFGALYLVSPFIWMVPPMVYRLIDDSLLGLDAEGAYLRMCMEVLPVGMLGLMLGGMVFATASSVNTSLNLAAAVLTNDVYKPLFPRISERKQMKFARVATLAFGLGTIGVACLVPLAGGIVEVVLSIGAVTGGALYGPAIWGLFSPYHTGKSILRITLISLIVNVGFKFGLFGVLLDRSGEMLLGVLLPIVLLAVVDVYKRFQGNTVLQTLDVAEESKESIQSGLEQNAYGVRVIAYALMATSLMFFVLGFLTEELAAWMIWFFGGVILVLGARLLKAGRVEKGAYFKK